MPKRLLDLRSSISNLVVDESPLRTAYPVSTLPPIPQIPPHQRPSGHASGSSHDPVCKTDMRKTLDIFKQ